MQINKLSGKLCDTGTPAILPECFALPSRGHWALMREQLGHNFNLNLKFCWALRGAWISFPSYSHCDLVWSSSLILIFLKNIFFNLLWWKALIEVLCSFWYVHSHGLQRQTWSETLTVNLALSAHTHAQRDRCFRETKGGKKHKWGKVYREMKQFLRIILELNLNATFCPSVNTKCYLMNNR